MFGDDLERCHEALPNEPYEESCDRSWFALWLAEVSQRWLSKALKNTDGDKLHNLIREEGQFEGVKVRIYNSPIGWDGTHVVEHGNGAEIGQLMVLNVNVRRSLELLR